MNLFLTSVFLGLWYRNLITWESNADFLFVEGVVVILCGIYQSVFLDPIYWKES